MEWVGGLFFVIFIGLWGFVAYMEREPEANPLAEGLASKRAVRRKSHNEWLLMWYNALPEDRRDHFETVWADEVMRTPWMMNATGSVDRYERQKLEFLLKCASNMVDAVTHETTVEAVGGTLGGVGRRDVLVGVRAGGGGVSHVPSGAGQGPKAPRTACATCACGPEDAC